MKAILKKITNREVINEDNVKTTVTNYEFKPEEGESADKVTITDLPGEYSIGDTIEIKTTVKQAKLG